MEQVLFGGWYDLLSPTDTEYNALAGGYNWTLDESWRKRVVSTDGVIKNLRVKLDGAPGAGKKYTFTLMLNENPTALSLDIIDANTTGSNMVNQITVTGGDRISIRCNPDDTPTARYATWTSVFQSDNANESLILGGSGAGLDRVNIIYGQLMCAYTSYDTVDESGFGQLVPTSGTIENFYVNMNFRPGDAPPEAFRFTVRLNGGTDENSPIVTIIGPDLAGNDLVNSLPVVAGDILNIMIEPLNEPEYQIHARWGLTFKADINGESIVIGGARSDLDDTDTEYMILTGWGGRAWHPDETRRYQLGQNCTLKKLHVLLTADPGTNNDRDFAIRIAGTNVVTLQISDAETTGDSGALEDTVALDEYVNLRTIPTSKPDAADACWGFVCYIEPPPEDGSVDLLGGFSVKHADSDTLLCGFIAQQVNSETLLGEFIVQQASSETLKAGFDGQVTEVLPGEFIVQQADSETLLGEFIVQHADSETLKAGFDGQVTENLLGKFIAQHKDEETLLGKFIVQQADSETLLGKFIVQQADYKTLLGKFEVKHSAYKNLAAGFDGQVSLNLPAEFTAQQASSETLLGKFIVQQTDYETLLCGFTAQQANSETLLGEFTAQHKDSEILFGEFIVQQSDSEELKAGFDGQVSLNLPAEFIVKHKAGISDPHCFFIVRHKNEEELPAEFTAQQASSETLLAEFIVQQASSETLKAGFDGQVTENLLGKFVAQHKDYETLLCGFIVQQADSETLKAGFDGQVTENLLGKFIAQHADSKTLLGKFIVQQADSETLLCGFIVQHADSETLFAEFIVKHADSEELKAGFDGQVSLDLPAEFTVQQASSETLLGKFIAQHKDYETLLCGFNVQQANSETLLGEFTAQHKDSEQLFGDFVVRHKDEEELPAEFTAQQASLKTLKASFDGQVTEVLPGEFIVQQADSETLLGEFIVQQADSKTLLAEFIIQHKAGVSDPHCFFIVRHKDSETLLCGFIVRHKEKEALLGEFIVRHAASEELHGAFNAQAVISLPAEFSAIRSYAIQLHAGFMIRQASEQLPGEFISRQSGAQSLLGKINIVHSIDLNAKFEIRSSTSRDLSGVMISRHADSQDLPAQFEIIHPNSEELLGKFQVQVTSDAGAVIISANPNYWINYELGIGTGFLDGPYLGPDFVHKIRGVSSAAILTEYLKKSHDYLKFGWLKEEDGFIPKIWPSGDFCVKDVMFVERIMENWDWDEQLIITSILKDTYTRLSFYVPGGNAGWQYANINYGTSDYLRCSKFDDTPPGTSDRQMDAEEIFIKFDLSSIDSLDRLGWARIELFRYEGYEYAKSLLNARRIAQCDQSGTSFIYWQPWSIIGGCGPSWGPYSDDPPHSWSETQINWIKTGRWILDMGHISDWPYMGLSGFTQPSPPFHLGLTTDNNVWDMIRVDEILAGWLDGTYRNEGFGIRADSIDGHDSSGEMNTFYNTPRFYSSRAADSRKPQLRLQYIPAVSANLWSFASADRWEINLADPYRGTGSLHLIDWTKVSYDRSRTKTSKVTFAADYELAEGCIDTFFRLNNATYPQLMYGAVYPPNKWVGYTTPIDNFFNIYLRYQDTNNYYLVQLKPTGENSIIRRRLNAVNTTLATFDSGISAGSNWSRIRIFWTEDGAGTLHICCFVYNKSRAAWKNLASVTDANNYWDGGGDIAFESYDAELDKTRISERII